MQRATMADGAELEYEVVGAGEPVVFIHGALIADTFRLLLAEPGLADRYRLIHYHRRGYAGSSRVTEPVSVSRQAADCGALLGHLGVVQAHVVGHSYGGDVALQLALDTPGLVGSLALLEPALFVGASAQAYRESLARGAASFREAGAAVVVDAFLEARCPGYRTLLDMVLPGAFAQAVADAETSFEHEFPGILNWRFSEAEASLISQPTLSVLGGKSATLSPRFAETHQLLLAWLAHAAGFVVPGATHFMLMEQPGTIAQALTAFWSRYPLPS